MAEKHTSSPSPVYRFGVFQANLAARELRKHGVRVRLPGQPYCILSMLLERPGEVVTREEMRQRLWTSETFVDFEHSLNTAITKLRAALGDSPENSRYIETVPRVGYRFVAPIQVVAEAPDLQRLKHIQVIDPPVATSAVDAVADSKIPEISGVFGKKRVENLGPGDNCSGRGIDWRCSPLSFPKGKTTHEQRHHRPR